MLFKDLRVVGLGASASFAPTLGSTLNPLGVFDAIKNMRHPPIKDILSGFEGVVRPGEMLCAYLFSKRGGVAAHILSMHIYARPHLPSQHTN